MNEKDTEELAVIKKAQEGDPEALASLISRYTNVVRVHIGSCVPKGRGWEDAEDLEQETWKEIAKRIKEYNPDRGTYRSFVRFWAGIIVSRYWRRKARERQELRFVYVAMVADLRRQFPNYATREAMKEFIDYDVPELGQAEPEPEISADFFLKSLNVVFDASDPPHQWIVFGFNKLLSMPPKEVHHFPEEFRPLLNWPPRRIVDELSDIPLRHLMDRFLDAYLKVANFPVDIENRIRAFFEPIRANMNRRFAETVRAPETLATYPALCDRVIGDTTLRDYFTGNPGANIAHWWSAVRRRGLARAERLGLRSPL